MYQQRAPSPEPRPAPVVRPWLPEAERADGTVFQVRPEPHDRYVVIDDIAYGGVVFDIAPWPVLDNVGRLTFEGERATRVEPLDVAQAVFDRGRAAVGQLPRPLRIGDAFLVRRIAAPIDAWAVRADVTKAARDAARLALFAAVAPRLNPEQAERMPPPAEPRRRTEEARGPSGPGTARPAV